MISHQSFPSYFVYRATYFLCHSIKAHFKCLFGIVVAVNDLLWVVINLSYWRIFELADFGIDR